MGLLLPLRVLRCLGLGGPTLGSPAHGCLREPAGLATPPFLLHSSCGASLFGAVDDDTCAPSELTPAQGPPRARCSGTQWPDWAKSLRPARVPSRRTLKSEPYKRDMYSDQVRHVATCGVPSGQTRQTKQLLALLHSSQTRPAIPSGQPRQSMHILALQLSSQTRPTVPAGQERQTMHTLALQLPSHTRPTVPAGQTRQTEHILALQLPSQTRPPVPAGQTQQSRDAPSG